MRRLALLLWLTAPAAFACDRLYTDGRTLWIAPEGGTRVAYSTMGGRSGEPAPLVVYTLAGGQSRTLPMAPPFLAVVALGWRGNDRVWIEGHVSPIASMYGEVDLETGRIGAEKQMHGIRVSPDGRQSAYVDSVDGGASRVVIGSTTDTAVRVLETGLHPGRLHWLPDGSLLVIGDDGGYVLADPATGKSRPVDEREARQWLSVTRGTRTYPIEDRLCR